MCTHAGFDTRVQLCHGGMGSYRRLLDIYTRGWDRYSSRTESFPSVCHGGMGSPFGVCCRQLLDVHTWSIYNSRCFFCVMVIWVAPLVHVADTRVSSYGELCMCFVSVCVCHPERAVQ